MNITTENYEIYFLDYAENALSEKQVADLFAFLEQHPELKDEFDALNEITKYRIKPEKTIFEHKDDLHHIPELSLFEITELEYLSIAELEGDINQSQQARLEQLINISKQNADSYNKIKHTRIKPDTDISFPKDRIKKNVFVMRIKPISYAAAAIITLMFGIQILFQKEVDKAVPVKAEFAQIYIKNIKHKTEQKVIKQIQKKQSFSYTQSNNQVKQAVAVEENEPVKFEDLNAKFTTEAPKIEGLVFRSTEHKELLTPNTVNKLNINKKQRKITKFKELNKPETLWAIAEGGVKVFRKMTDSELYMNNSYTKEGMIEKLNLSTSNFKIKRNFSH